MWHFYLDNKNDEAVDVYILIFPFKNSITSGFKKIQINMYQLYLKNKWNNFISRKQEVK